MNGSLQIVEKKLHGKTTKGGARTSKLIQMLKAETIADDL